MNFDKSPSDIKDLRLNTKQKTSRTFNRSTLQGAIKFWLISF